MLIYNHNKEFVGIDAEDLQNLGYKSLSNFLIDYNDFADLFVKKPGFIHNFKNFPWIDFVLHAEAEESKAIIKTESKEFTCDLAITPFFLASESNQEGYAVTLKHIRNSSGTFAAEPAARREEKVVMDIEDDLGIGSLASLDSTVLMEPDLLDIPDFEAPAPRQDFEAPAPRQDFEAPAPGPAYDDNEPTFPDFDEPFETPQKRQTQDRPMLGDSINKDEAAYLENLSVSKDYIYDPKVASDELGLPVDLIEEFIGDFIQQSHEFKDKLFDVTMKEDFDEVHALSHKLKGVAANLRIEDSFEVLNIINHSTDQTEIEANLKQFYRLVAKLEGKEAPEFEVAEPSHTLSDQKQEDDFYAADDDIYDFGLLLDDEPKQDAPKVEESITPDTYSFDIPEESSVEPDIGDDLLEDDFNFEPVSEPETVQRTRAELHYNSKTAASELGLDQAFVAELVDEFATEAKEVHLELNEALQNEDYRHVQSLAMELKGASDNLRITEVSALLQSLIHTDNTAAGKKSVNTLYDLIDQL